MASRIRMRTKVSRTAKGFSVEGTVEWEVEVEGTPMTVQEFNNNTDTMRENQLDQQSALIAGLDHRFPVEGAQQA